MSKPAPSAPHESAAQRQARLRALAALQRDALEARWQPLVLPLQRADTALARVRRLRRHPVALALLAASASGLLVSQRGRHALGLVRAGWRVGLRAATVLSMWRALRAPVRDADAPRAPAGAPPGAPDAPSRSTAGAPDRPA